MKFDVIFNRDAQVWEVQTKVGIFGYAASHASLETAIRQCIGTARHAGALTKEKADKVLSCIR